MCGLRLGGERAGLRRIDAVDLDRTHQASTIFGCPNLSNATVRGG